MLPVNVLLQCVPLITSRAMSILQPGHHNFTTNYRYQAPVCGLRAQHGETHR